MAQVYAKKSFVFVSTLIDAFDPLEFIVALIFPNNRSFSDPQGLSRAALAGILLGLVMGSCPFLAYIFPNLFQLFFVIFFSCFYHMSEFFTTAYGHPEDVTINSFLFHHSTLYSFIRLGYFVEYFFWSFFFHSFHTSTVMVLLSILGMFGVVIGQSFRSLSMYHAGRSFTHIVATTHSPDHKLIVTGIYHYFRHPSYFGWGLWVMSLQLVLGNPINFFLSGIMSYEFFSQRIPDEEEALVEFFGKDYEEYRKKTPTWIPFIR